MAEEAKLEYWVLKCVDPICKGFVHYFTEIRGVFPTKPKDAQKWESKELAVEARNFLTPDPVTWKPVKVTKKIKV